MIVLVNRKTNRMYLAKYKIEVAAHIGVSQPTVSNWAKCGDLMLWNHWEIHFNVELISRT